MLMPRKINVDLTTGAIGHAQFYSRLSEVSDCEGRQGFRGLTLGPVFPFSTASTSKTASPHAVTCSQPLQKKLQPRILDLSRKILLNAWMTR